MDGIQEINHIKAVPVGHHKSLNMALHMAQTLPNIRMH